MGARSLHRNLDATSFVVDGVLLAEWPFYDVSECRILPNRIRSDGLRCFGHTPFCDFGLEVVRRQLALEGVIDLYRVAK